MSEGNVQAGVRGWGEEKFIWIKALYQSLRHRYGKWSAARSTSDRARKRPLRQRWCRLCWEYWWGRRGC